MRLWTREGWEGARGWGDRTLSTTPCAAIAAGPRSREIDEAMYTQQPSTDVERSSVAAVVCNALAVSSGLASPSAPLVAPVVSVDSPTPSRTSEVTTPSAATGSTAATVLLSPHLHGADNTRLGTEMRARRGETRA